MPFRLLRRPVATPTMACLEDWDGVGDDDFMS
jgi:hypothetical protein